MKILFPGSFDPFTIGHENLVKRVISLFKEHVDIYIAITNNEDKESYYSIVRKVSALDKWAEEFKKNNLNLSSNYQIVITTIQGHLTYDYAKLMKADFILRGLRNTIDFEYEKQIAEFNKSFGNIETLFLMNDPSITTSSSVVRTLVKNREYEKAKKLLPVGYNII